MGANLVSLVAAHCPQKNGKKNREENTLKYDWPVANLCLNPLFLHAYVVYAEVQLFSALLISNVGFTCTQNDRCSAVMLMKINLPDNGWYSQIGTMNRSKRINDTRHHTGHMLNFVSKSVCFHSVKDWLWSEGTPLCILAQGKLHAPLQPDALIASSFSLRSPSSAPVEPPSAMILSVAKSQLIIKVHQKSASCIGNSQMLAWQYKASTLRKRKITSPVSHRLSQW